MILIRNMFSTLILMLSVVSAASETVSRQYQYEVPLYNWRQEPLARIGLQIQVQKEKLCLSDVSVEVKQLDRAETPMAYIASELQISDLLKDETGARFQLAIHLRWDFKNVSGSQQIGLKVLQCLVSCEGQLNCRTVLVNWMG